MATEVLVGMPGGLFVPMKSRLSASAAEFVVTPKAEAALPPTPPKDTRSKRSKKKGRSASVSESGAATVVVSGLYDGCAKALLAALGSTFGKVRASDLTRTGFGMRFGYVTFEKAADASAAVATSVIEVGGHKVSIQPADATRARRKSSISGKNSITLTNLAPTMTRGVLESFLHSYKHLPTGVTLRTGAAGRCSGEAVVVYATADAAREAGDMLSGVTLAGRPVKVAGNERWRPKSEDWGGIGASAASGSLRPRSRTVEAFSAGGSPSWRANSALRRSRTSSVASNTSGGKGGGGGGAGKESAPPLEVLAAALMGAFPAPGGSGDSPALEKVSEASEVVYAMGPSAGARGFSRKRTTSSAAPLGTVEGS